MQFAQSAGEILIAIHKLLPTSLILCLSAELLPFSVRLEAVLQQQEDSSMVVG